MFLADDKKRESFYQLLCAFGKALSLVLNAEQAYAAFPQDELDVYKRQDHNSGKLRNVFRAIDFNSQVDFGEPREKNATLRNLLEDFHDLDLRPSQLGSSDIIGDAYEYMIAMFASDRCV